jgi:hypothetical protein
MIKAAITDQLPVIYFVYFVLLKRLDQSRK